MAKSAGHSECKDVHVSYVLLGAIASTSAQRVWQEGMLVRACCVLTSLLVTKIRERNTVMNQDLEHETKGRVMPALLLFVSFIKF